MVNVKRYVAKTAREALAKLKEDLGPDAVVLSNRATADGVEIVALPASEMGELNATVRQARAAANPPPVAPAPATNANHAAIAAAKVANATEAANRAAHARAAARLRAEPEEDSDFTVNLGQQIARIAQEDQMRVAPKKLHSAAERYREGIPAPRVNHALPGMQKPQPEPMTELPKPIKRPVSPSDVAAERPSAEPSIDMARMISLEATNAQLNDELASLKGMVERQLSGFAWNEMARNCPARTQLMSELMESGFSPQLSRQLTEKIEGQSPITEARKTVRTALSRNLRAISSDADIIDKGGVYALVGPTGVGKTTTTAKLAARCVVRHGADKLALITTDGYRIGAHEQLRIYGRILGVAVHVVRDAADLRQTLQDLRNKHMVLIDTIGMSQRDKMVADQAAMLHSAGNVRRLLCLNATASGETLDDVLRAYEGHDLAGCILTKVDEAGALAPVVDVAARHELDVYYIANGQRVPEDLHLPNREYLVHRALREIAADSPYKLDQAEAALKMAQNRSVPRNQDRRGAA